MIFPLQPAKPSTPKANNYHPLALAIALVFSSATPSISRAATYTVMNTNDTGAGSLRQAVMDANVNSGADTILFDSVITGSTIDLTGNEIKVTGKLTITGPTDLEPSSIVIDGNNNSRIFNTSQSLTLENLTLSNGFTDFLGGAIYAHNYSNRQLLTLNDTIISNNTSDNMGGGIALGVFDIEINDSIVTSNTSNGTIFPVGGGRKGGGGLYSKGQFSTNHIIINDSVFSNNTSTVTNYGGGGGIFAGGYVTINNSSFINNSALGDNSSGGGAELSGEILINNSEFKNNTSTRDGGGLHTGGYTTIINNTTISGNTSNVGGGIILYGGSKTINQSTISNNSTIDGKGGGLASKGSITINQSTVSNNNSNGTYGFGAGLYSFGDLTINQSTITNNTSEIGGAGIHQINYYENSYYGGPPANFKTLILNTILAENNGPDGNLQRTTNNGLFDINNSLFGDPSSEIDGNNTANIFSNAPNLGILQDNGGSIRTHLPNLTSPAINAGNNLDIPSSMDQRGEGFPRILSGKVDIGAVEVSIPSKPIEVVKRNEIIKPLLQAALGDSFTPDTATGQIYDDVAVDDFNASWIEKFTADGFTEGCAIDKFCPNSILTKAELAKLVIKVKLGFDYSPMPATGIYADVAIGSFNADWIETLNLEGITMGCDTGKFCPEDVVTVEVFNNVLNSAFP